MSLTKDGNTLVTVTALSNQEVEVYDNVSGQWVLRGDSITAPPGDLNNISNKLLAMEVYLSANGNIVAISDSDRDYGRGLLVRVFQWNGTSWSQMGQTLVRNHCRGLFWDESCFICIRLRYGRWC